MHRLLVLACIIGAAAAYSRSWTEVLSQGRNNHRHKVLKISAVDAAREVQKELIETAQKMRRFCHAHSDRTLTQALTATHYTLTANLTGCSDEGLIVRAGQRLVAVQVHNHRCDFISLQLLPNMVDATSAFWRFKKEQLTVFFPYDLDLGRCGRTISDRVHSLPKLDGDIADPDIDVRFEVDSSEEFADLV